MVIDRDKTEAVSSLSVAESGQRDGGDTDAAVSTHYANAWSEPLGRGVGGLGIILGSSF